MPRSLARTLAGVRMMVTVRNSITRRLAARLVGTDLALPPNSTSYSPPLDMNGEFPSPQRRTQGIINTEEDLITFSDNGNDPAETSSETIPQGDHPAGEGRAGTPPQAITSEVIAAVKTSSPTVTDHTSTDASQRSPATTEDLAPVDEISADVTGTSGGVSLTEDVQSDQLAIDSETEEKEKVSTAHASRILRIEGLDEAHNSIQSVIFNLHRASHGVQFSIQRATIISRTGSQPFIQLEFACIHDCTNVKRALETNELVADTYRNATIRYREEAGENLERIVGTSSSVAPQTGSSTSPVTSEHAHSAGPGQNNLQSPRRKLDPASIGKGIHPLPPFPHHLYGILICHIPRRVRHLDILNSICGGIVRRMHIFRPGKDISGDGMYAAVFFLNEAKRHDVLDRIMDKRGLMINSIGRRYRATEYISPAGSSPVEEVLPNGATRIISITFDDSPANLHVNPARISMMIRQSFGVDVLRQVEVRTSRGDRQLTPFASRRIAFRKVTLEFTGIRMAMNFKEMLTKDLRPEITGSVPLINYERDPCSRPVA